MKAEHFCNPSGIPSKVEEQFFNLAKPRLDNVLVVDDGTPR
jgi:hypothetical protein